MIALRHLLLILIHVRLIPKHDLPVPIGGRNPVEVALRLLMRSGYLVRVRIDIYNTFLRRNLFDEFNSSLQLQTLLHHRRFLVNGLRLLGFQGQSYLGWTIAARTLSENARLHHI